MADETILSPNEIIEITPAMLRAGVEHLVSFDARDGCPDAEAVVRSQQFIYKFGALPADLPFEEPAHYKLVINLKTAKATGIELPMNFLALANEVIE